MSFHSDDEETSERSRIMSSIQSDLENVEGQLLGPSSNTNNNVAATGRAVFSSIHSALGSIRSRLEDTFNASTDPASSSALPPSPQQQQQQQRIPESITTTTAIASRRTATPPPASLVRNSLGGRLWERLQRAELAHSTRIPLNMLAESEFARNQPPTRGSGDSAAVSSSSNTTAAMTRRQYSAKNDDTPDQGDTTTTTPTTTSLLQSQQRRSSSLLASRRRAVEAEGPEVDMNLHGTMSSLQSSVHDMGGDIIEVVMEDEADGSDEEDGEIRTILLTKNSRSNLNLAQQNVLFPDQKSRTQQLDNSNNMETDDAVTTASSVVYSWGLGVNSLHDDSNDVTLAEARVRPTSRVGRTEIVSCSVGEHHTACVTAAGQVLMAGCNTSGEVDPDRKGEELIAKPSLLESLSLARIVQVSCGFDHTAALRSNGAVLTWGSNEFGQLGHHETPGKTTSALYCRPAIMALAAGHRATAVACGDGFTLCLTSRMSVLACGVGEITGFGPKESVHLPKPIPALENLPLVGMAAGRRHAVVLTAHGSAFAWGDNANGKCGREYPKMLSVPVPIKPPTNDSVTVGTLLPPPLTNWAYRDELPGQKHQVSLADDMAVVHAACGADHTVLVTRSGRLLVCGSNSQGQIGLDPNQCEKICHPQPIVHPSLSRKFVRAEAGNAHTLLLDNMGDLWQMGGSNKAVGCTQLLVGKGIFLISAGGEQSVAIAPLPSRGLPRRQFSDAVSKHDELFHADCVEELIGDLREDKMVTDNEETNAGSTLTVIANRAEELFRTPAVMNSLFMDPTELDELFSKLLSVDSPNYRQTIVSSIERGMLKGLDTLQSDNTRLMWPEQVRFLLLYIQCPMFVEWKIEGSIFDRRGDLILSLCETILGIPYEGYTALMVWSTSVYSKELFVRHLIRPLLSQLKKGLSVEAGAERRPVPAIVAVLRWLYNASERAGHIVAAEDFYSDAVSNMQPEVLYDDLQRFKIASKQKRAADFFLCDNPFLMSPSTKRNLLQMDNEMNMLKTASKGLTYNFQERTFEFNPFYTLDVDREHMFTQTLQKISHAKPSDLRKKLRVVFKGEDAVDAGGVTKEFFSLLTTQLFDYNTGMWSTRFQDGNITWFNSDCNWNDEGYYLSGILVGLAVYNSVLLDVNFPQAVYRKLLAQPLGLEDMVDEEIKSGLQHLLDYEGDDVEDVFCLTFAVNWVHLGQQMTKELKPKGSDIAVTSDNREEYVMLYVKWLLAESIYPQFDSFESGFMRVMEDSSLDLLRPEELELLVVGSPDLDFVALENNTVYEGGYSVESEVVRNFWRFVRQSSKETQLNLLKFTTGSSRAPIGGLGKMYFKIQRAGPDSENLPTSHTCFNTLLLPDYGDNYEKLEDRLGRAILECEGFGLQ